MLSRLCCRFLRSWSGRLKTRAGLFSEGTQTSPDLTTRWVWMPFFCTFVREVKCRKSHISVQKHRRMITNWGQCLRWLSQRFRQASLYCWIALWKWLELHKEALCFQITTKSEPNRGNRSPVIWGNAARNWRHYIIPFQEVKPKMWKLQCWQK